MRNIKSKRMIKEGEEEEAKEDMLREEEKG